MSAVFEVTQNGITAPAFDEVLEYFQGKAREIFGQDIVITPDSQDGQLVAIFAQALADVNAQAVAVYSAFSPSTAKGIALDTAVKTNGLTRHQATHSTADLRIVGQAGTTIRNGVAIDTNGNKWMLPATVVIPTAGEITVTATAQEAGDIAASAGAINRIGTATLGWQTVSNPLASTVGLAQETDDELRTRQSQSTSLPSVSLWEGIIGAVLALDGVRRISGICNNEDAPTKEGVPGHTIALIVDGGEVEDIARTIYLKGGEGTGTYGSVSHTLMDDYGFPHTVRFSRPTSVAIKAKVTIKPSATYLSDVANEIKQRIADYINGLAIGTSVNLPRVLSSAVKDCDTGVDTRFDVQSIELARSDGALEAKSITIAWNEAAMCSVEDVTIEVQDA